ncbi:MAG: hypothetical protein AB7D51_02210 [Desulfovibrionaceae bacterium]
MLPAWTGERTFVHAPASTLITLKAHCKGRPRSLVLACLVLLPLCLPGCAVRTQSPGQYLSWRGVPEPAAAALGETLTVCTGFGCRLKGGLELGRTDLDELRGLFWGGARGEAVDAPDERARIALAVARLEHMAGRRTGTDGDLERNRRDGAAGGQLDCVAETTNTTVYLLLLERLGVLRYHRVGPPEHRGGSVFTAHNTAVVFERSGTPFAVDSWFHANGEPPEIVPLDQWLGGFQPASAEPGEAPVAKDDEAAQGEEHGV